MRTAVTCYVPAEQFVTHFFDLNLASVVLKLAVSPGRSSKKSRLVVSALKSGRASNAVVVTKSSVSHRSVQPSHHHP